MYLFCMNGLFDSILQPKFVWTALAIGAGVLLCALVVLMYARWGQAKPLYKCVVLSVFAHVLLLGYAYVFQLFEEPKQLGTPAISVMVDVGPISPDEPPEDDQEQPWESLPTHTPDVPQPSMQRTEVVANNLQREVPSDGDYVLRHSMDVPDEQLEDVTDVNDSDYQPGPRHSSVAAAQIKKPRREPRVVEPSIPRNDMSVPRQKTTVKTDRPKSNDHAKPNTLVQVPNAPEEDAEAMSAAVDDWNPATEKIARELPVASPKKIEVEPVSSRIDGSPIPKPYIQRVAPNRIAEAKNNGGSPEAEMAVQAALDWLVIAQNKDGRWDASKWGAGRERKLADQNRGGAGMRADTGITGLAVLAFLGAGQTHLKETLGSADEKHRKAVQHGLQFLIRQQAKDGNLSGGATRFAAMYCHGIATLALSEAYAMTGDDRLRAPLIRAINYTLSAQDPITGGWRYRPGDRGDMSQFGWQLMSLVSAEHGGLKIPAVTKTRMAKFLDSVSVGGKARYMSRERVKRTMTAEALICRFLLEQNVAKQDIDEAANHIVGQLPGAGPTNYYYWYYGTLALYQLQDERWELWNKHLQTELIGTQRMRGELAGSWDTLSSYGGNGGRVYTTALATLCLEVYYRYLPMMQDRELPLLEARRRP